MDRYKQFKKEQASDIKALQLENPDFSIWHSNRFGIKKSDLDISGIITEERIMELSRCQDDIYHFIENYIFIQTRDRDEFGNRIRLFKLRKYQKEVIDLYLYNRFVTLLFPRRAGKTSVTVAYVLWRMLFEPNYVVVALANKDRNAVKIITEVKNFIKNLPLWMSEGISKSNEHEIIFENGSRITAYATAPDSGRAEGANCVILDECAFIDSSVWEPMWSAIFPVVTDGENSQLLLFSTPNGLNHFWKICEEASMVDENGDVIRQGTSEFILKTIKWNDVPGRDENFKRKTISTIGEEAFRADFECDFVGSAGTLLDADTLKKMVKRTPLRVFRVLDDYDLKIYQEPDKQRKYIVTHDPASGHGGEHDDNTAIIVWDVTNIYAIKQVAVLYDKNLDELDAPFVLHKICKMYNNALEISERNKAEGIPMKLKREMDYENVFCDEKGFAGIHQTESSRNVSIAVMRRLIKEGKIEIVDAETIFEFSTFIKRAGKYQADTGKHDDLVMSTSLLCFLLSDEKNFDKYFTGTSLYQYIGREDVYNDIFIEDSINSLNLMGNESFNFEDEISDDDLPDGDDEDDDFI